MGLDLRQLARAAFGFAVVSGIGLCLDFGIFLLLVRGGVAVATANLVSSTAAVTFVYFVSVKRIFSYHGQFLLPLFLAYLGYQAVAVTVASVAVGGLAVPLGSPALAKIAILPFTFGANFLFMSLLTRRKRTVLEAD